MTCVRFHLAHLARLEKHQQGFSLIELITVLVIVGVVSAVAISRSLSQDLFRLQAARDNVKSILVIAQQHALIQPHAVRLIVGGQAVDIRRDDNDDQRFDNTESLSHGQIQYPLTLPHGIEASFAKFDFDRLGQTQAVTFILKTQARQLELQVSAMGLVSAP